MNRGMARIGMRVIGLWVIGILTALALIVGTIFAAGAGKWITAPFRGEVDVRERTVASGAFRLATYEEFFSLCASVQNAEAQIASLELELETDPPQGRITVINSSLSAIRSNRAASINEYNSKAGQEHRRTFQDNNLPEQLDINNEGTQCVR